MSPTPIPDPDALERFPSASSVPGALPVGPQAPRRDPPLDSLGRIDGSHEVAAPNAAGGSVGSTSAGKRAAAQAGDFASRNGRAPDLLSLHVEDLIDRLRGWSSDLDARESLLNARAAELDRRDRQLRTTRQSEQAELVDQRRELEQLRRETERRARQLAFALEEASRL